ncbi:MAG: MATE family efflux transporter, partial [Clostridia bacterium]|nr:MATE family efflux transporter [Clostridia bacterium]
QLIVLVVPLMGERLLTATINIADSVMVSSVSESAVSGMTLATKINDVFWGLVSSVSIASAIRATQYVGKNDFDSAAHTIKQSIFLSLIITLPICVLLSLFASPFLNLIYSDGDPEVISYAVRAFRIRSLSCITVGLNACLAKIYICQGKALVMLVFNLFSNLFNITGNYIFIHVCGWEVEGAAFATVLTPLLMIILTLFYSRLKSNKIRLESAGSLKPDLKIWKKLLALGLPTGFENNLSYFAKVMVSVIVVKCSVTEVNANSVAQNLDSLYVTLGCGVGAALMIVAGQCMGAGKKEEVKHYTKWLVFISMLCQLVSAAVIILFMEPILAGYHLSPETASVTRGLCVPYLLTGIVFWTLSYTVPNSFRACGDVKYCMTVSTISLWGIRVALAYLIFYLFRQNIYAIWIASYADWAFRSVSNLIRFRSGKWLQKKVI